MKIIMPTIAIIMMRNVTIPTRETTTQTRLAISYFSPELDSTNIVTFGDNVKNTYDALASGGVQLVFTLSVGIIAHTEDNAS